LTRLARRGTVDSLSGGASRRIALRDGKTDAPTPLRSDPVPEEEAPRMPRVAGGRCSRGEGAGTGAVGGELHPRVMTDRSRAPGPQGGSRVIPYASCTLP